MGQKCVLPAGLPKVGMKMTTASAHFFVTEGGYDGDCKD